MKKGEPIILPRQSISRAATSVSGSILIIAIWSLFLLSTFAVILGYEVRQKLSLVNRIETRDKLRYLAEAGALKAIADLKKEPSKTHDALKDSWSNNPAVFKGINIGDGRINISYEYYDDRSEQIETRYGLIDEERKININTIDQAVLERLFRIVLGYDEGNAKDLAASIIDWRDSDSVLSLPSGSAEDSYYRSLSYPYEAKDSEFEVLEEVLLVKGMTQENFAKLKDYITMFGNGKVNINTASKSVLLALGLTEAIVEDILLFRAGEDGAVGTGDDNIFEQPADIIPGLSRLGLLSDPEVALLGQVQADYFVTNSNNFMLRVIADLPGKKDLHELTCVIDRKGKILYWREN